MQFITGCDPTQVADDESCPIIEIIRAIAAERFDGGTPAVNFGADPWPGTGGGWPALIHETEMRDGEQYIGIAGFGLTKQVYCVG